MQVQVDARSIAEVTAVIGSAVLGTIILANHWRNRSGRLFGLLCLSLSVWKAFEYIYPGLSDTFWVDAMGWATGIFATALSFHFIVAYVYRDREEPRYLFAAAYPLSAVFIVASALGWVSDGTAWQVFYCVYFLVVVAADVALLAWSYHRKERSELIWALLGTLSLALGVFIQLVAIMLGAEEFYGQTYGMLAFVAFFGYDIAVGGFLREHREHLRALEELGLRERKLEEAEESFRRLMDTSFDVLFTMDESGEVMAVATEDQEVLGFPVERLLGKGYQEFINAEDQVKVADAIVRGLRGEKIRPLELTLYPPEGRPVILHLSGTRLRGEGKPAALVIARDVTGTKRMERELKDRNLLLEEANRRLRELDTLKTELVGLVGHELRSPLTVIYSYAAALKDHWDKMDDERKLECIDHVLMECDRLNRMVENVLDMGRIDSGRLILHLQKGDLVTMLGEVTREMAMASISRPVQLITSLPGMEVDADWDKVKQVVINLLDNAFRFSPPDAQVVVTGDIEDGRVIVRVKDSGPGIAPQKREMLFEKFTQSKADGMERGLGLGLYIVRTFVEAHGGKVWLEDEEGFGTVVAFSLPFKRQLV